jgi:flagellar protein FliS
MSPFAYPPRPAGAGAPAAAARRSPYLTDAVGTASPARLVTMLYDRLLVDLDRAGAALAADDLAASREALVHAQEIVLELKAGLRPAAWSGGPALDALYSFLHSELVAANVSADPGKVTSCRAVVEPLADAWHQAARKVLAAEPPAAADTAASVQAGSSTAAVPTGRAG